MKKRAILLNIKETFKLQLRNSSVIIGARDMNNQFYYSRQLKKRKCTKANEKMLTSHNQTKRILEHINMFFNISMVKLKSLKSHCWEQSGTQSWWEKQVAESVSRNPWRDP